MLFSMLPTLYSNFFHMLEKYLSLLSYECSIQEHVYSAIFSICLCLTGIKKAGEAHTHIFRHTYKCTD